VGHDDGRVQWGWLVKPLDGDDRDVFWQGQALWPQIQIWNRFWFLVENRSRHATGTWAILVAGLFQMASCMGCGCWMELAQPSHIRSGLFQHSKLAMMRLGILHPHCRSQQTWPSLVIYKDILPTEQNLDELECLNLAWVIEKKSGGCLLIRRSCAACGATEASISREITKGKLICSRPGSKRAFQLKA